MKIVSLTASVAGFSLLASFAAAQEAAPPKTAAMCESCHGPNGDSTSPSTPRLNGQQSAYIAAQLRNFRDPTREDPHAIASMWNVMIRVDDASIPVLAAYFASQIPAQPLGHGVLLAAGKKLFAEGAPAQKVPACQTCHGARGEGAGLVPRLAGQHAAYLTHQLEVLRLSLRESSVMHPKTNEMTDDQITALVAFLAND